MEEGVLYIRPTLVAEIFGESFLTQGKLNIHGASPNAQLVKKKIIFQFKFKFLLKNIFSDVPLHSSLDVNVLEVQIIILIQLLVFELQQQHHLILSMVKLK